MRFNPQRAYKWANYLLAELRNIVLLSAYHDHRDSHIWEAGQGYDSFKTVYSVASTFLNSVTVKVYEQER